MATQIINGKEIAASIKFEVLERVKEIKNKFATTPTLAVILVGNDPASEVYVNNKEKALQSVEMNSVQIKFPDSISENDLLSKIEQLNNDPLIHGILVQLPLPKHIDSHKIIHSINHIKDVDGFNIINAGKLAIGEISGNNGAIIPCTPLGCLYLIKIAIKAQGKENLRGLKTLVIGSSNIVGRPMARLLMLEGCTVTIANSATKDLKSESINSDIIISAAGVPGLVKKDMVKNGAIVIDVGINRIATSDGKTKLVGDVDFDSVKDTTSAITPVPGGVGPMTIAFLLKNTLDCYLKQAELAIQGSKQ